MLEPLFPRLLTALLDATRAGRIAWHDEEDAFTFSGSQGQVHVSNLGLWPRFSVTNQYETEIASTSIPSGDDAFDRDLRALVAAIEDALAVAGRVTAQHEQARRAMRDAVVAGLLAELAAELTVQDIPTGRDARRPG